MKKKLKVVIVNPKIDKEYQEMKKDPTKKFI